MKDNMEEKQIELKEELKKTKKENRKYSLFLKILFFVLMVAGAYKIITEVPLYSILGAVLFILAFFFLFYRSMKDGSFDPSY